MSLVSCPLYLILCVIYKKRTKWVLLKTKRTFSHLAVLIRTKGHVGVLHVVATACRDLVCTEVARSMSTPRSRLPSASVAASASVASLFLLAGKEVRFRRISSSSFPFLSSYIRFELKLRKSPDPSLNIADILEHFCFGTFYRPSKISPDIGFGVFGSRASEDVVSFDARARV